MNFCSVKNVQKYYNCIYPSLSTVKNLMPCCTKGITGVYLNLGCGSNATLISIAMSECNTILTAYTLYRHLG